MRPIAESRSKLFILLTITFFSHYDIIHDGCPSETQIRDINNMFSPCFFCSALFDNVVCLDVARMAFSRINGRRTFERTRFFRKTILSTYIAYIKKFSAIK